MAYPISALSELTENLPGNYVNVNDGITAGENMAHATFELNVTTGSPFTISAVDNVKLGVLKLTGSPGAGVTINFPDGDRLRSVHNECGQTATIDTVTGSSVTPTVVDGAAKLFSFDGVEIRLELTWTVLV